MEFFNNSFFIWVIIAAVGLLILRFILNVTRKILTLGIVICIVIAVYFLVSNYFPGVPLPFN